MTDKEILSEDAILDLQIEIRNCDSENANAAEKKILASHEALRAERGILQTDLDVAGDEVTRLMNVNAELRAEVERLNRVLKTVDEGHKDALKDMTDCIEKHQALVAACQEWFDKEILGEDEVHALVSHCHDSTKPWAGQELVDAFRALRAEREELARMLEDPVKGADDLIRENAKLRAEVERLKESLAKWHAAYGLKPPYVADEYQALVAACREYKEAVILLANAETDGRVDDFEACSALVKQAEKKIFDALAAVDKEGE